MALSIILFCIAVGFFAISFFHFIGKGPLFNNAYLFASNQERKTMDKKPHYRQSAIIFSLLGVIFLLIALEMLLQTGWLYAVVWSIAFITVVYAIASSIKGETKGQKR